MPSMRKTPHPLLATLAVVGALLAGPHLAAAGSCKADGDACRTNRSCCSGACVTGPPESSPSRACCTPTSCAAEGANCGSVPNGTCPYALDCGSCAAPHTCGGGGTPNVCGCTPTTCSEQNAQCGTIADGCGGTLNCGRCPSPSVCGADGTPNVCGGQTPCATTADCIEGRKCISGLCQPRLTNLRPCMDALDCLSGCCCNAGAGLCQLRTDTFLYQIPGLCTDPGDCSVSGDDRCPLAFAPAREILECN